MVKDIASGMEHLHELSPPRIHRDLKSTNVFISDRGTAKIGDFGTSSLLSYDAESVASEGEVAFVDATVARTITAGLGSLLWMAPERLQEKRYGLAVDVYR